MLLVACYKAAPVAFVLSLAFLPLDVAVSADRSELIQLLDMSFKCSPGKERLEAGGGSAEVKYRYRFSADEAFVKIVTHYVGVGRELPAQEHHGVEQTQVATMRLSDLEVSRSWDSAFDKSVHISCTTDKPCITHSVVLDRSTHPIASGGAEGGEEAQQALPERQFDSFAASYFLCDAQTAEYGRSALAQLLALAKAARTR
ncbi:MAG TPA: hypothetical protein VG758_09900 [Hyphomicrobiaceae bacterium]|jgi:hypothetical protein|nr:hypothetical protein [Hyphomicrobiaceae bacterium]